MADSAVQAKFRDLGQDTPPREKQKPEAFGAFQKAAIEKCWPLIKPAKIKAE
jgi:hypothetical protein